VTETTGADGKPTTDMWVLARMQQNGAETLYYPHTVEVVSGGTTLLDSKMTIDEPVTGGLSTVDYYTARTWANKFGYQKDENVILYAEVYDWAGSKVTPSGVTGVVTLPDASTDNIVFLDDGVYPDAAAGDNTFTVAFTNTSQVGTYNVVITAAGIGGNNIIAELNWDIEAVCQNPFIEENIFLDETSYDVFKMLTGGRIRVFPDKATADAASDGGAGEGEIAIYQVTAVGEGVPEGCVKTYKMTREP